MFKWINQDLNKVHQGVWRKHDGMRFKIGSPSKLDATQNLEKQVAKIKGKRKDYQLKASEQHLAAIRCVVDLKLLDWEVKDKNGEEIPYSKKNAENALVQDPEFLAQVNEWADDQSEYEKDAKEEAVKK